MGADRNGGGSLTAAQTRAKRRRERLRRAERALRREGIELIAGTDEVGAGPLAGPLVAAAVILPPAARLPHVDDSKRMTAERRDAASDRIKEQAIAWAIVEIASVRIDVIGPYAASLEAMARAIVQLDPAPQLVLSDARTIPEISIPQRAIVGGDGKRLSIAAASVLAKVHRDRVMRWWHQRHPEYGFDSHKGYGTPDHLDRLKQHGPCPCHRRKYAPVRECLQPAPPAKTLFD